MRSIFSCCPPLHTSPRTCPGRGGKARRAPRSALRERVVGLAGVTGQVPRPHGGFGGAILEAGLVKQTGGHYSGSWYFVPRLARVADRGGGDPGGRSAILGVRLIKTAP